MRWSVLVLALVACGKDDTEDKTTGDDDDGDVVSYEVRIEHVGAAPEFKERHLVDAGGRLVADESVQVTFHGATGDRISFAMALPAANDVLLTGADVLLEPGDISDSLLWVDIGTEDDQSLGFGADQMDRQAKPGDGAADFNDAVREFSNSRLDDASDAFSASLSSDGSEWTLTLTNLGSEMILTAGRQDVEVTDGVLVVHRQVNGLFALGEPLSEPTLEPLAEDGDPSALFDDLDTRTGITVPLATPFWVVTSTAEPLFATNSRDYGQGLEALAEDGVTAELAATWEARNDATSMGFVEHPDGTYDETPVLPGQAWVFEADAAPGDRLHVAWMFAASNDIFFAFGPDGVELSEGNATKQLSLWDAGTEVNQLPGFGSDQAAFQSGPDTGEDEGGVVRPVDDGFDYPKVADVVRFSVTAK